MKIRILDQLFKSIFLFDLGLSRSLGSASLLSGRDQALRYIQFFGKEKTGCHCDPLSCSLLCAEEIEFSILNEQLSMWNGQCAMINYQCAMCNDQCATTEWAMYNCQCVMNGK